MYCAAVWVGSPLACLATEETDTSSFNLRFSNHCIIGCDGITLALCLTRRQGAKNMESVPAIPAPIVYKY